jgi:hypothetical protein
MKEILLKAKLFPSPVSPALLHMTAGRTATEFWWTNQEFPSVNVIPPWFFLLLYHLEDEQ